MSLNNRLSKLERTHVPAVTTCPECGATLHEFLRPQDIKYVCVFQEPGAPPHPPACKACGQGGVIKIEFDKLG